MLPNHQRLPTILIAMDHYSAERLLIERRDEVIRAAERRARLRPLTAVRIRPWMAERLRMVADRLEGAPVRSVRLL